MKYVVRTGLFSVNMNDEDILVVGSLGNKKVVSLKERKEMFNKGLKKLEAQHKKRWINITNIDLSKGLVEYEVLK